MPRELTNPPWLSSISPCSTHEISYRPRRSPFLGDDNTYAGLRYFLTSQFRAGAACLNHACSSGRLVFGSLQSLRCVSYAARELLQELAQLSRGALPSDSSGSLHTQLVFLEGRLLQPPHAPLIRRGDHRSPSEEMLGLPIGSASASAPRGCRGALAVACGWSPL